MTREISTTEANAGWRRWRVPAICLALAAMTFAVFGQTLGQHFINFDDGLYVSENSIVAQGLTFHGIAWQFTHADCSLYHPLTMLSLMAESQIHGMQAAGFHFTNVLIHTASVILLFLILRQLTGTLWRSAFVAAVFAIHPLRVESVAWVSERKDVLSGFFFMLTLAAYVHYVRKISVGRYLLVAGAFAMALLSKPTTVTLPFVLLLVDFWPLRRMETQKFSRLVLEKLPLLALSLADAAMTVLAVGSHQQTNAIAHIPLSSRLANAIVAYAIYLRQMIWPQGLRVPYEFPRDGRAMWEVTAAGALLIGLSAVAWRQRRTRPWLLAGWLWYLGILVPMLGIVQVGVFSHADRYTYLAQIGIYAALTWQVAEWRISRRLLGCLMAGVLSALMICAWKQASYWQDDETLWNRTLAFDPNNKLAQNNLAATLLKLGHLDDAIGHFRKALQIDPDSADVRFALATALLEDGKVDESIKYFTEALQINPNSAEIQNNLGNALLRAGKVSEAAAHFQRAMQIDPNYPQSYFNLGGLALRQGKTDDAAAYFQKALQFNPGYAQAHYDLGNILLGRGKVDDAIAHYEQALQNDPAYEQAEVNLGNALTQKGAVDEAIAHYEKALQLDPQSVEANVNLGRILSQRGYLDDAIVHFQKALLVKPSFGEAHSSLGSALAQKGNVRAAIGEFQAALRLQPGDPEVENNLAWLLAASPDLALRNGPKAVELAQDASARVGGKNPFVLRTLAAAFAQAGKYDEAKSALEKAISLVNGAGRADLAAQLKIELTRYQARQPFPH